MSLLEEILERAAKEQEYYGNPDEGCCYKCNCQWSVDEICNTCEQCPDCCECGDKEK